MYSHVCAIPGVWECDYFFARLSVQNEGRRKPGHIREKSRQLLVHQYLDDQVANVTVI